MEASTLVLDSPEKEDFSNLKQKMFAVSERCQFLYTV